MLGREVEARWLGRPPDEEGDSGGNEISVRRHLTILHASVTTGCGTRKTASGQGSRHSSHRMAQ